MPRVLRCQWREGWDHERECQAPLAVGRDLGGHDAIAWCLTYDDGGLQCLELSVAGRTFVHHSGPRLVGADQDTVFAVMAFDAANRRHDLEVRLREVREASAALGCDT